MFNFFANIFGYILNFLYNLVNNYGLAIILFTLLIKIIMLPLLIKQQKTLKKSSELQEKMKILQFKYKNDPEQLNREVMSLYKEEKMNPFSGCFSAIVQFVLIISIFYLVKSPLTYMKKIEKPVLDNYISQIQQEGKQISDFYPEIDIIREKGKENEDVKINMDFLGLDLSKIPQQNINDYTVYILPALYIISSFISIRMTTAMTNKNKQDKKLLSSSSEEVKEEINEVDTIMQTNKMMSWLMPIMSISIAFVAPLGLALYWLINNLLMIVERIVLNYIMKKEESV